MPQVFVSMIDDEICGYLLVHRDDPRYRWTLAAAGAGSSRLDATDEACIELWSAMRAGQSGIRRLFAAVIEGTPAHASLCAVAFVAYGQAIVLRGGWRDDSAPLPPGFREQHASDVWSIHQLYHRSVPRTVQFAEALTSEEWELPSRRDQLLIVGSGYREHGFVVDSEDGVSAYARVTRRRGAAYLSFMLQPDRNVPLEPFFAAALRAAGVGARDHVSICVPGYLRECVGPLEQMGLTISEERTLLVKHTTAPAIVHAQLAPLPNLRRQERRAVRRVPSLMQGHVAMSAIKRRMRAAITESECELV
jgi:hypothetical protein